MYADRIIDAEGTPVATGATSTKPTEVRHGPVELRDLLKHLSDAQTEILAKLLAHGRPDGAVPTG